MNMLNKKLSLKYIPHIDIQNNTMHINFTILYTTSITKD